MAYLTPTLHLFWQQCLEPLVKDVFLLCRVWMAFPNIVSDDLPN